MVEEERGEGSARMRRLWRWLLAALILAAMVAVYRLGWHRQLTLETLAHHDAALAGFVDAHRGWAILAFAGLYAGAVALSLPGGLVLTIAGGYLFGWLIGGLVVIVAASIGATILFLIARSTLGAALARRASGRLADLAAGLRRDAFHYLLFLRLVPLFPFWLVNLAPALVGVPLRTYVLATVIGIMPASLAFAIVGSGLDSVIAAQTEAYETCLAAARAAGGPEEGCRLTIEARKLVTPQLVAALAALGVLALVPLGVKKIAARRRAMAGDPAAPLP